MRLHTQAVHAITKGFKAVETLKVHGHGSLAVLMDQVTKHVELALTGFNLSSQLQCGEVGVEELEHALADSHAVAAHVKTEVRAKALTAARDRNMRLHTQAVHAITKGFKAVETLKVHGHGSLAVLMDQVTKHVELALTGFNLSSQLQCGEVGVEELEHALSDSRAVAAHVKTEVRAKVAEHAQARAEAEAKAVARVEAEANAALAKAQADAKAATEAKAEAEAKAAAAAKAEAESSAAVIKAANARLQSFLTANAPKSAEQQEQRNNIDRKNQQKTILRYTQVTAKRRRLNKYEYLVIKAAPPPRLLPRSGAIMFVDETEPQQQFWNPNKRVSQQQLKSSPSMSTSLRRQQQHALEQSLQRTNNTELCNNTEIWSTPPPNVSNTRHPQQFRSSPSAPHSPSTPSAAHVVSAKRNIFPLTSCT